MAKEYDINDLLKMDSFKELSRDGFWQKVDEFVRAGNFVIDPEFPDTYIADDEIISDENRAAYQEDGARVFSHRYAGLVSSIICRGIDQRNERTEQGVRVLLHREMNAEIKFGIPLPGLRAVNPAIAAAELAWMFSGTDDISWLQKHTKIWDKFAVDGKVDGAYGVRWRHAFGRDQLQAAINTLKKDPSSRQIMISAWDPGKDGLDPDSKALAPCPVDVTFQVLEGRLNASVHLRSSDVAVGLPYDTMVYALLLDAVAEETGLKRGCLRMNLDNAHIYHSNMEAVKNLLEQPAYAATMDLPKWKVLDIEKDPDGYVAHVKTLAATARQPANKLILDAVAAPAAKKSPATKPPRP